MCLLQDIKAEMDRSPLMYLRDQKEDINRARDWYNKSKKKNRRRGREGEGDESSLHLQRTSQETCLLAGAVEDSCVWCGIFKRINAAPIPAPCLTYFQPGLAIVLFLSPVGHAVVDSHANEARSLPGLHYCLGEVLSAQSTSFLATQLYISSSPPPPLL